jgi:hypothetical protein
MDDIATRASDIRYQGPEIWRQERRVTREDERTVRNNP